MSAAAITINNLTFENIHALLEKNYDNKACCKDYSEKIVNDKKFFSQGTFKNGNRLVALEGHHAIFGVLTPAGDLLSVFFIYDTEHVSYREKHDIFIIRGHETMTEVDCNGELDEEYTR